MKIKEVMTEVEFLASIEKSCTQIIQLMHKYEDEEELENINLSGKDCKSYEFMHELEKIFEGGPDFYALIRTLKSFVVDKRLEYQSALNEIDIPNLKPVRGGGSRYEG